MFTGSEIPAIDFILLFHTMNVHNVQQQYSCFDPWFIQIGNKTPWQKETPFNSRDYKLIDGNIISTSPDDR